MFVIQTGLTSIEHSLGSIRTLSDIALMSLEVKALIVGNARVEPCGVARPEESG